MEVVETIVFLTLTIIVGSMVVLFVSDMNAQSLYNGLDALVFGEDNNEFRTVGKEELPSAIFNTWQECGLGQRDYEMIVSYQGNDEVTKQDILNNFRKFNLCHSFDCENGENLNIETTIDQPSALSLACDNATETMTITTV